MNIHFNSMKIYRKFFHKLISASLFQYLNKISTIQQFDECKIFSKQCIQTNQIYINNKTIIRDYECLYIYKFLLFNNDKINFYFSIENSNINANNSTFKIIDKIEKLYIPLHLKIKIVSFTSKSLISIPSSSLFNEATITYLIKTCRPILLIAYYVNTQVKSLYNSFKFLNLHIPIHLIKKTHYSKKQNTVLYEQPIAAPYLSSKNNVLNILLLNTSYRKSRALLSFHSNCNDRNILLNLYLLQSSTKTFLFFNQSAAINSTIFLYLLKIPWINKLKSNFAQIHLNRPKDSLNNEFLNKNSEFCHFYFNNKIPFTPTKIQILLSENFTSKYLLQSIFKTCNKKKFYNIIPSLIIKCYIAYAQNISFYFFKFYFLYSLKITNNNMLHLKQAIANINTQFERNMVQKNYLYTSDINNKTTILQCKSLTNIVYISYYTIRVSSFSNCLLIFIEKKNPFQNPLKYFTFSLLNLLLKETCFLIYFPLYKYILTNWSFYVSPKKNITKLHMKQLNPTLSLENWIQNISSML